MEKEGAAGLLKGIGKGIGGLIMKPGAGRYHPIDHPRHQTKISIQQFGDFQAIHS